MKAAAIGTGTALASVNPAAPSQVVGRFEAATPAEVRESLHAASRAQVDWAALPAGDRAAALNRAADELAARGEELAQLITSEQGKPLRAARGEVSKTVEQFRLSAQLAFLVEGSTYPQEAPGTFTYTLRTPLGVIVAITPWNFPVSLAARKIAPALAAGNAVVFKPSPVAAMAGELLADSCYRAGVPRAVLPVIHGDDREAMAALTGAREVRAVTFTGSDAVGELLRTTMPPGARLQFELGGHNAALVCADADLERAARAVADGAFGLSGQVCTATDRVFVADSVLEPFTRLLGEHVTSLRVGRGQDAASNLGPVSTNAQCERLRTLLTTAIDAGAKVLARGSVADDLDPEGYWVAPTALLDVPPLHPLNTAEVFGPLLSILPATSPEQAIAAINADPHGLVNAVHTRDLGTASRFARSVRSGVIKINERTTGNGVAPPFGGWGASSSGAFPEGGRGALEFVTDTKTVYCNYEES
jgi:acyl-CoA reductase-like NAD-dependent aldehyde dehydrogenase